MINKEARDSWKDMFVGSKQLRLLSMSHLNSRKHTGTDTSTLGRNAYGGHTMSKLGEVNWCSEKSGYKADTLVIANKMLAEENEQDKSSSAEVYLYDEIPAIMESAIGQIDSNAYTFKQDDPNSNIISGEMLLNENGTPGPCGGGDGSSDTFCREH